MRWITDWKEIDGEAEYVVCPVNARDDGTTYLGQPQRLRGWAVVRLREKCYAAILIPPWTEADHKAVTATWAKKEQTT